MGKQKKIRERRERKPPKKRPAVAQHKLYKIEGDKITRLRKVCPKCGPGVFLAEHKDRVSCGKCSYAEFKKK
ncbi:30S ribosomal protein S27ae [Candidatus Woesearchaeota archaeon]|nr:30S ribosomal protein S27ae [Candidatus Woesearchaeota archaeon]